MTSSTKVLDTIGLSAVCMVMFVICPAITLLVLATYWLLGAGSNNRVRLIFIIGGASFLGFVNATKQPESDLITYLDWFAIARTISLSEFMESYSKEPLYFVSVHLLSNMAFSSEQLYIFVSTVACYSILLIAFSRLCAFVGIKNYQINAAVVAMLFFPPLFSLSAHLMRQILAGSLVFWFYVELLVSGKKRWLLPISATFIHYSAIVFVFFALVKKIPKIPPLAGLALYVCILPISYFAALYSAETLQQVPYIGKVFLRVALEESYYLGDLSVLSAVFVVAATAFSVYALVHINRRATKELADRAWATFPGVILLGTLVLAANLMEGRSEIAVRYYFYTYVLIWLAVPFILASKPWMGAFVPVIALVAIIWFIFSLIGSTWTYAPVYTLLTSPSWVLWDYYRY